MAAKQGFKKMGDFYRCTEVVEDGELVKQIEQKSGTWFKPKTDEDNWYKFYYENIGKLLGIEPRGTLDTFLAIVEYMGKSGSVDGCVNLDKIGKGIVREKVNISYNTLLKHLEALITKGALVRLSSTRYAINPDIFWRGGEEERKEAKSRFTGLAVTFVAVTKEEEDKINNGDPQYKNFWMTGSLQA